MIGRVMTVLALLLVASTAAACQFLPPQGISRDRAIELALRAGTPLAQATVTGARSGRLRDFRVNAVGELGPGVDMSALVWEVSFQGNQSVCQPMPGGACQVVPATAKVYLDQSTGAFIFSETTGKPPPPGP